GHSSFLSSGTPCSPHTRVACLRGMIVRRLRSLKPAGRNHRAVKHLTSDGRSFAEQKINHDALMLLIHVGAGRSGSREKATRPRAAPILCCSADTDAFSAANVVRSTTQAS